MSDKVVIDGDMTLTSTIDGEGGAYIRLGRNPVIEPLNVTENGTYEVPEGVDGFNPVTVAIPEYEGAYTVTPTPEIQTLPTAGKVMTEDVTVEAVEPVLWKTVTLEEVYDENGLTNFMNLLGIEESSVLAGYDYVIFAIGNADTSNYSLKMEVISIFDGYPDAVQGLTIRRPTYSNVVFGRASYIRRYMTAGTVIKVYRFKR